MNIEIDKINIFSLYFIGDKKPVLEFLLEGVFVSIHNTDIY